MKDDRTRGAHRTDGLLLLNGLREAIQAQFVALGARPDAGAVQRLLLALELRCKLEEMLLFPALYEALRRRASAEEEREIATMRTLAAQAREAAAEPERQRMLLVALEGVSLLHFDAVERLAAGHTELLDRHAIGAQAQALLSRWQGELLAHGDIEDEEADPVGQPPR